VIDAALELVDADGLGRLSMRRLAERLGVSAMTPYSYFSGKAELLEATVATALGSLDAGAELPWEERVAAAMTRMHDALERHPGLLDLVMAGPDPPQVDEFRGELLAMMEADGMKREQARDALRILTAYTLGLSVLSRRRDEPGSQRRRRESFDRGLASLMDEIRRGRSG
jgi:AcrR family transcriptional regulator